ncbi:MAG: methylenetetrahydrofolate reductase C-terminal domain-containing protein [Deltaproteobacteria bacterium]|nr:methylenetetrahydrofolate reductase C-terminal domain-containing protein [Deltaproteobacteria bacterium]
MFKVFRHDLADPDKFVVTLELVPGRASFGKSIDTILAIAQNAFDDGRISAVSITDNPGGNPSISPDVLGYEIFKRGMDVIVHFACRDMNRTGMESRALQLARMGMKNIMAITGDYPGKRFGGQGAPVFDLDSVGLTCLLSMLNQRLKESGEQDGFFTGCGVSPFKSTEAECFAQYAKLSRKINAGASFIITQLGYDVQKYSELVHVLAHMGANIPLMGSVYLLSPKAANAMNRGVVPGAVVSDDLLMEIKSQWKDPPTGLKYAVDRTAGLGIALKRCGYKGIHIGGIHRSFKTVAAILDRMDEIEKNDETLSGDTPEKSSGFYYAFSNSPRDDKTPVKSLGVIDKVKFTFLNTVHNILFNFNSPAAPLCKAFARWADNNNLERYVRLLLEDPLKKILLSCRACGDCGIKHLAFQCPESGCPKHTRNGACGGSRNGMCEVHPDRKCVWVTAYYRLKWAGRTHEMIDSCVPPRMWELYETSSWINFHLERDHESRSAELITSCSRDRCSMDETLFSNKPR